VSKRALHVVPVSAMGVNSVVSTYQSVVFRCRLLSIVHCEKKLYLVFEYLALDLKRYMDSVSVTGLPMPLVKVQSHRLTLLDGWCD